ncbi:MAG: DUF885 domain-containing protein [Candidatus Eremiobacteraeota bacterium]|nr:DUF885 domain-containing protein [Candidatus Eremiobacteraeota bacterium]
MGKLAIRAISAALMIALVSVGAPPATASAPGSADAAYAALAGAIFAQGFKDSPTSATSTGIHTYDTQVDDMSAAAIESRLSVEKGAIEKLEAIDPAALSPEVAIDRTMLLNNLRDDQLLTGTLATWRHNPDLYTGLASGAVFELIARKFAPLEVRMRDAVARENALPALFAQAQANLTSVDSATQEIAYQDALGSIGFFAQTVPEAFASVKDPALRAEFTSASTGVVKALRAYAAFIKAIKPSGTYAIGAAAYKARLQYEDSLDIPVSEYLGYGERALARTRAQFIATAKKIDPSKTPAQVYASLAKVHPAPNALLATATNDLVRLRAFVTKHHIITLPAESDIKVVETPAFERAFITAQMSSPGALERVATQAYYNVTPVDPKWPKARQEGFLAQFNDYQRPIISLHEVYPGHFANFTIDKHLNLSLTRRLIWNAEFGEGWAHYSEQMMVDQGWGNGDPHVRLAQLDEAMLRECRYIVGVKLHTAGWTLKQAQKQFTDGCFQTPAVALEETMRGTQDPMYGYYTLGKLMILKLRDDYKKKMGAAYTLQKFHDALLAHGDPPLPLLRPILLGAADDGHPL